MGLIGSGLIMIVAFFVLVFLLAQPRERDKLFVGGEPAEMNMDGIRVVKVSVRQSDDKNHVYILGEMTLANAAAAGGERKAVYPKNDYLKVSRTKDTLLLELDFTTPNLPEQQQTKSYIYTDGLAVQIYADTLTSILCPTDGLDLKLKQLATDSISICGGYQDIVLDSCRLHYLSIDGKRVSFEAKKSEIDNLHLNLDRINRWSLDSCKIDTEYLRGSGHHRNHLQTGECRKVMWVPAGENARLELTFPQKSSISVEP